MICADVGYVLETTLIVVALVTFVFFVSSFSINGEFKLFTILSVVVIAFNLIFVLFGRAYFNYKFIIACLVCLLVSLILIYMSKKTTIRSKYGDKVYGEALGFREFLLRAEKDKLEKLVEENPKYYYDILPYVYVLNVSDKWVKKFEGINIPQPDWYVVTSFSLYTFNHSMSRMSSLTAHAMSSSSKSSSDFGGGGFSGGGFSGGGGGGGGGSSW